MINGNNVTQNIKHTYLFNKKKLLHTLFLQTMHQQVYLIRMIGHNFFELITPIFWAHNLIFNA